jgi:hypothetical protein
MDSVPAFMIHPLLENHKNLFDFRRAKADRDWLKYSPTPNKNILTERHTNFTC